MDQTEEVRLTKEATDMVCAFIVQVMQYRNRLVSEHSFELASQVIAYMAAMTYFNIVQNMPPHFTEKFAEYLAGFAAGYSNNLGQINTNTIHLPEKEIKQ